jgi:hypothetical protein
MKKLKIALGVLAALAVVGIWQALHYWFNHGYSVGTRSGVIRKLSVKGPPYCKYLSGELALQGSNPGQPVEVWEFSVDDSTEQNPLVASLHDMERQGKLVTLRYRQDLKMWWRCTPAEFFVTSIEK